MSASVRTHQVIQLSGFPIFRRVTHLTGQPRFAFAKSHAPPSASSRRSVARPALAYGFPSRWLSGEGFFQPSGSADMPGAQVKKSMGAVPKGSPFSLLDCVSFWTDVPDAKSKESRGYPFCLRAGETLHKPQHLCPNGDLPRSDRKIRFHVCTSAISCERCRRSQRIHPGYSTNRLLWRSKGDLR